MLGLKKQVSPIWGWLSCRKDRWQSQPFGPQNDWWEIHVWHTVTPKLFLRKIPRVHYWSDLSYSFTMFHLFNSPKYAGKKTTTICFTMFHYAGKKQLPQDVTSNLCIRDKFPLPSHDRTPWGQGSTMTWGFWALDGNYGSVLVGAYNPYEKYWSSINHPKY